MSAPTGGGGGGGGGISLVGIAAIIGIILVGYAGFKNLNLHRENFAFGETMPTAEGLEQGPFTAYPGKEFTVAGVPNYCMNGALNADKLVNLNTEPRNKRYLFKFKLREDVHEAVLVTFVLYKKGTNGCKL